MSFIAPISALSIQSIDPSDNEYQEIPDEFPSSNYGEKSLVEIMAKIPDDITLTLCNAKFLEKTPGNSNGVNFMVEFPSGLKWVKFKEINLKDYVLGDPNVLLHTMRYVHGSNNEILSESDPGPIYLVHRLWDPGGPSYNSR